METKEFKLHGISVTQVHVQSEQDAEMLGRPRGLYITLETGPLHQLVSYESECACMADQLRLLLEPYFGKALCVCGIGNQALTYDALGSETARRFQPKAYESFSLQSNFEKVVVICPSVSALTNLPSETIISGVAAAIGAACVLTVDASICKDVKRLCSAIDLTSSGMCTYSAASNLCRETLGIPVVSIAVPTVIRAADVSMEGAADQELLLTPTHIMDSINTASFIIACAITQTVYPELDYESCKRYIGLFLNGII